MAFELPLKTNSSVLMTSYLKSRNYNPKLDLEEDRLSGVLAVDNPLDEETFLILSRTPHIKDLKKLE